MEKRIEPVHLVADSAARPHDAVPNLRELGV